MTITLSAALITLGGFSFLAPISSAATTIPLGTASTYGVLASSGLTNAGATTVTGDIGLSPSGTYVNTGSVTRIGNIHTADAAAATAQVDATTAYNNALAQASTHAVVADLGGQTLTPGVYSSATGLTLTGTVTLDAGGDANAIFIFQTPAGLTTSNASSVTLINGAYAGNVFWQIGTTVALGTNSTMNGNVLDNAGGIISGTNATTEGRLISLHGSISLTDAFITVPFPVAPVVVPPVVVPPVVVPTGCPVFTTLPAITASTNTSLTISWADSNTGSWQLMTHANDVISSGNGVGGLATAINLSTYSSNTQTVVLWSGPNNTGCRLTQAITGTTAGGPVLAPLPPVVVPPVVIPPAAPNPPVDQVPTTPTGPVKTGDGSLGKAKR